MILANIKWLLFTRAIRKTASSTLSAALQLFLLIKWRSLRTLLSSDFRASTESEPGRIRVNCDIKKRNEQTALANAVRFSFPFLYYMIFKMSGQKSPTLMPAFNPPQSPGFPGNRSQFPQQKNPGGSVFWHGGGNH